MANACGVLGDGSKAVKVHHLIKAPENTPESVSFRESWDASKPVSLQDSRESTRWYAMYCSYSDTEIKGLCLVVEVRLHILWLLQ